MDAIRESFSALVRDVRPAFDVIRIESAKALVRDKDTSPETLGR